MQFDSETRRKIDRYVANKLLAEDVFMHLFRASTPKDMIKGLQTILRVNSITLPKVWTFIVQTEWKSLERIFDQREIILIKHIINNDGAILRKTITDNVLNEYMATRTLRSLEEREIIDTLTLESNEKIVIVHPKFVKRIFDNG